MTGIGRHTDYATRIVLHLSGLARGTQVTAREIANRGLLPQAFIRRIVGRLAAAGILRTTRGSGGGVVLARDPSEISLLDVVRAMEGNPSLNACVDNPLACPLSTGCPVNRAWIGVTAQVVASLQAVSFDQLASDARASLSNSETRAP